MDNHVALYALIALVIRVVGTIIFLLVLIKQVKLRFSNFNDNLNRIRNLLILVTLVPFVYNFLTIYNNYLRFTNGHQNEALNTITFVGGAVASTVTALGFYLFYRSNKQK